MSAEVETMFSNREVPWHGLGTIVSQALNSTEALKASGLDWEVSFEPITVLGEVYPDRLATVRSSDNKIFGIVSKEYSIVQNAEAFRFTDDLIGQGVTYETAGALFGGRKTFMLANLPPTFLMGEKYVPYLVFTNSHDGSAAVTAAMTPVRVVCNNTLTLALQTTPRQWSIRHSGDISTKIEEARKTLTMAEEYMETFSQQAEEMSKKVLYQDELFKFVEELFPLDEKKGKIHAENVGALRQAFATVYTQAPDLKQHQGTAWGVYQAVSDMVTHRNPFRETANYKENRFMYVAQGHPVIQKAEQLLAKVKA